MSGISVLHVCVYERERISERERERRKTPGGGKRGQFARDKRVEGRRKREGYDEVLSEQLLSLSCLSGNLDTHTHTHTLLL